MPPAPLRPFIGRAEERARLLSLWAEAEAGRPGFALVSGDAGVGKTHLLESVIRAVGEAGGQVLTGACIQVGDYGVPYLPIVDALRAVESDPAGAQLLRAEAARRPALGRLIPHLTSQPVPADDLGEGLVQGQLFEAVHRVLSELAETRPVLLVVEDLHWADRSTRHLLSFLARTMRAGRVVVLASYRTDDLHRRHPLRPLLAELTRLPHVVRVPLHSFTLSETAELLDVLAGTAVDPAVIEAVHRRSEGNAFFAEELWRAYAAGGTGVGLPSDLADLLLTKVEGLPQAGRDVLALAAVAWRDIPYELLVRVAEPDGIDVDEGLRQAIEAGVLIGDGERYSFRHALLREAVHGDLLPGQRVRLHARFADVLAGPLEGLGLTGRVSPAELAHYRLVSHDQQGALQALLSAAAEAEAMAAPAEALVHLEQAVELVERLDAPVDRIDLLTRAAEAAAAIGDAVRARRLGQQVVQEADRSGQVLVRASARIRQAVYLIESDAEDAAAATAREAVDLLADEPPSPLQARALATWARTIYWRQPATSNDLLRRATELADRTGDPLIATDALITRALLVRRGQVEGDWAQMIAQAAGRAGREGEAVGVRLRALRFHGLALMEAGEMEAALTVAEDGVALAEKAGVRWGYYGLDLRLVRGWALAALGRWDEALAASVEAVYAPTPPGRVLATLALAVLVDRGDPEAGALLQRLRGTGDEFADVQLLLCETKLRLREGLPREAVAVTERAMTVLGSGPGSEGLLALTLQATAHADLAATARLAGDAGAESVALSGARAAAEAAQGLAGEPGLRGPFGELWLRRAALEADRAVGTVTGQDWHRLADLASRAGRIPDRMYALGREADARLAAGDRGAEAVAALSEALTIARRLGAAPDIVVLESLAHRSRLDAEVGLHPARRGRSVEHSAPQGVSLTEREREVLRLVAEGRSNRQIGKALFISDKTASVHVSNILVKLQAGSRTEAAALARAQGLLAEERTAVPPG